MAQSPFGPDTVPPGYTDPNFNVEAQGLARKRAITNAILARSLQPPQPQPANGGLTVPISPLQGLSGLVQQYFAARAGQDIDSQEQKLAQQYQTGRQKELQDFLTNPTAPGADTALAASNYPQNAAVGKAAYEARLKGMLTPGERYKTIMGSDAYSPESKVAFSLALRNASQGGVVDPDSLLQSAPKVHVSNENIVNYTDPNNPTVKNIAQQFSPVTQIPGQNGPMDVQTNLATGKIEPVDKSTKQTITVGETGAVANAKQQAALMGEAVKSGRDLAVNAVGDMRILGAATGAYNQGVITGTGAQLRTSLGKALETFGMKSPDPKISNTDFFAKQMAGRLLAHSSELKPMSDPDRQFLNEVYGGAGMTDSSLRRLIQLGIDQNSAIIAEHNGRVEDYAGTEGSLPGMAKILRVPAPPVPKLRDVPAGPQPRGTLVPFNGQLQ